MNRNARSLHQLFSRQAGETPKSTALIFQGESITYEELDNRSDAVARHLASEGLIGRPVGLFLNRGIDYVVAMLGVLKSGGACVPLPPTYPAARLQNVADLANLECVLADTTTAATSPFRDARLVLVEDALNDDAAPPSQLLSSLPAAESAVAFVLASSGSTGKPKLIARSHDSFMHRLSWTWTQHPFVEGERCCQKSHMTTTHSVYELFEPLLKGVPVVIYSDNDTRNIAGLSASWRADGITRLLLVPSLLNALVDVDRQGLKASPVRVVVLMGEAVDRAVAKLAVENLPEAACVYSVYGTSEASSSLVCDLREALSRGGDIPLGKPITQDVHAYVLDANGQEVEPGAEGTLHIAGTCLFSGYLGATPESSPGHARNPFGTGPLYDTRDRVKVLADGSVLYLGRTDNTVKVRGFRVDLGDVEQAIASHWGVREVVVVVRDGEGGASLSAFTTPPGVGAAVLREHARAVLPDYMVPAVFVELDAFPRSPNGKVDRQALRAQAMAPIETVAETPDVLLARLRRASPVARDGAVRRVLQEEAAAVLGLQSPDDVSAQTPLKDLGLNSIMAILLRQRLCERFGANLSVTLVFDHPTIATQARYIIRELRLVSEESVMPVVRRRRSDDGLAIVGVACRYPGGATSPEAYWRLLRDGKDAIREVPADRWNIDAVFDANPNAKGKMYTRNGGFLEDVLGFEPTFFGISPREARSMDPQQRLLLEVTWEALENAGIAPASLAKTNAGVFVGVYANEYSSFMDDPGTLDVSSLTGTLHSVAAGRISYTFGFQGPCVTIDTACSSSLVALHLACQNLRLGECDVAIVGGSSVILSPKKYIQFSMMHALSPDGRCKTFDASADGFGRGEGCGVVVVKRLSSALSDGDRILGVISGTAINHDGKSNGLTAPSGPRQTDVIRSALAQAGITPADVDYIECHGTGTPLGDPVEVQALAKAFRSRPADQPIRIGSVKPNIGHTEGAAGVAGLIKTVLAMQEGALPPTLHFKRGNPHIPWLDIPVSVVDELTPWPSRAEGPRRAGVSGFGFSGTNAHIIIEEAPVAAATDAAPPQDRDAHVLPLAARTHEALVALASQVAAHLRAHPEASLADVGHTLGVGRNHFEERLAVVGSTHDDLASSLEAFAQGQKRTGLNTSRAAVASGSKLGFLFTGQGSQFVGMGRALYETYTPFREAIDRCSAILKTSVAPSLLETLYPTAGTSSIDETAWTQPALFALEYAICELWRSFGIVPDGVCGHSIGEFAAACVAGVFSLEDGLALVTARGRLMQALPRNGAMVSVRANEEVVARAVARFPETVSVAGLNAPDQTVISGLEADVLAVVADLEARGIETKRLNVSHAFHSPLMAPILDEFRRVAESVTYSAPRIPVFGNVSGEEVAAGEIMSPDYWVRHVSAAVRFSEGIASMARSGFSTFVEVGPRPVLTGLGRSTVGEDGSLWLPSMRGESPSWPTVLSAVAQLYVQGRTIDWKSFDAPWSRQRVALPTYPFQRQRFSVERVDTLRRWTGDSSRHPLLGKRLALAGKHVAYDRDLPSDDPLLLGESRLGPGAILEMALGLAETVSHEGQTLEKLSFASPAHVGNGFRLQSQFEPDETGGSFSVFRMGSGGDWVTLGEGRLARGGQMSQSLPALSALRQTCRESARTELRRTLEPFCRALGKGFDLLVADAWRGKDEVLVHLRDASPAMLADRHVDVTIVLELALRAMTNAADGARRYVAKIERVERAKAPPGDLWLHVRMTKGAAPTLAATVRDASGAPVLSITNATLGREEVQPEAARPSGARVGAVAGRVMTEAPAASLVEELRALPPGQRLDRLQAAIMQETTKTLGLQPGSSALRVDTRLREIGLDSLVAVELRDAIVARTGRPLPASFALQYPTIGDQARFVLGDLGLDEANNVASIGEGARRSVLVPLRPSGGRAPLFCFHDVSGDIFTSHALTAGLAVDQPVYAFRARGVDTNDEPLDQIGTIAESYLSSIRRVQPTGPYHLLGYSMGSLIAFEVAKRLRATGADVGLLALVDLYPGSPSAGRDDLAGSSFSSGIDPRWAPRDPLPSDQRLRLLRAHAGAPVADIGTLDRRVIDANMKAMEAYRPEKFDGRALVFRAMSSAISHAEARERWLTLCAEVEVVDVPGNHFTVVTEPNATALARELAERLDDGRSADVAE